MGAVALATTQPSFSERVAQLLDKIDCRLIESEEERDEIYRLRYEAYLREGAITPNLTKTFSDQYDETDNVWLFGLYIDGDLASSIRIHVASRENPAFPGRKVFSDILEPELQAGKVLIDPTRFVTDKHYSKACPGLPYVTLRLCWLAAEYFRAEHFLVAIRTEHQAFYRRTFMHELVCDARPYPTLTKPISLMTVNQAQVADQVHRRYPFFRSSYFERRMLFEPHTAVQRAPLQPRANLSLVPAQEVSLGAR